jgi:N6-L-threonylcarbamoyladenine synthase
MSVTILAIESSCDDTSAAVVRDEYVLSNLIANQDIHRSYGGVVPELASRAHQANIVPVTDQAIKKAGIGIDEIDAVAFTRGPGLLGSLLVGTSFAKGFALARKIPLIEVNHLQAHVLAHFIRDRDNEKPVPGFPFLCLLVSGGHTRIIVMKNHLEMEVIGNTIDDAAGEAFDKCGKVMGLPYPAGPVINKLALPEILRHSVFQNLPLKDLISASADSRPAFFTFFATGSGMILILSVRTKLIFVLPFSMLL